MHVDNIYKRLFELLTAPHGTEAAALGMPASRAMRRELLLVAKKEECLPDVYAQWEGSGLLSPAESVEQDMLKRRRESAAEVAQALPAGTVLLRGASSQRHWPAGGPRFASDLEVMLPDFGAVGLLHEAVKRLGYRLRGAGQWYVPLRDPMHRGFASYRYWTANSYESSLAIDVQVAGVPVDGTRSIPFADLADKAARLEGLACLALHPARQLLRLVAGFQAAGEPVTVRQLADVHHLLKASGAQIDHAQLRRRIEQHALWGGLSKLREAIVAKRLSTLIDWGELGRLIAVSTERAAAAMGPRGRAPRADKGRAAPRPDRAGTLVRGAFELLQEPRGNDLAAKAARASWLVAPVLNGGHRVRGVPVSSKSSSSPQLLRIDGSLYIATGAGLFLLSLLDLSDGARADVYERLRTARRPVVLARWTGAATR